MRYFKCTESGSKRTGYSEGFVLCYPGPSFASVPTPDDTRWEEVLVTEKPKLKTWTRKVAIFKMDRLDEAGIVMAVDETYSTSYPRDRTSDWVEVTFTERTDVV